MLQLVTLLPCLMSAVASHPTTSEGDKQPPRFLPALVGTKWMYQEREAAITLTVTDVKKEKRGIVLTVGRRQEGGKVIPQEKVLMSERGIYRLPLKPSKFYPPVLLLELPAKVGAEWEYDVPGPFLPEERGKMKISGIEIVQVPAGKYKAFRVEKEILVLDGMVVEKTAKTTYWYAPGVGLVKKKDYKKRETVLKSLTVGKE